MSEIDGLRNRMDDVTIEMVRLLKDRADIAGMIGEVKKSIGKAVADEDREESLREKVMSLCREIGMDENAAARFLNFLLNESIKIQSGGKETHLSIFLKAKRLERQGTRIIHMEVGEPDFGPPRAVRDALTEACDRGITRYGQARGMPELRDALAAHASSRFGAGVTAENIIITPGARFAVFAAITTLLSPGDEMVVIEPGWPAYKECAQNAGIKVRTIHTTLEDRWEPSVEQIRHAIGPNTRMIVLNYPNNPTGKILPERLQDEIVDAAIGSNLYILSDEIYADYARGKWKSVQSYGYGRSIVTQSFSKSHAMTGFRIGYGIAGTDIIRKMARLGALCLTSVPEPVQYAALKALDADISSNTNTVRDRLEVLTQKAAEIGMDFAVPDGAMYLFARVGHWGIDSTDLALKALQRGLAVAPGGGFGDYTDFVRISACQNEKTLIEGMDILSGIMGDNA